MYFSGIKSTDHKMRSTGRGCVRVCASKIHASFDLIL